jgi:hypothetical protein
MVASTPVAAASPDAAADRAALQALWVELLARLSHAAQECARPAAVQRLRVHGVRRTGTAALQLAREYADALRMAAIAGVSPADDEVLRRTRDLALRDDFGLDLRELVATYEALLLAQAPRRGTQLHRWLSGRCRVHAAQAEAIGRED